MRDITVACLDMAGTTVADDGSVMAAFTAAAAEFGLVPGAPGYADAIQFVQDTMGQSKIEVFRRLLGSEENAQQGNHIFEESYAAAVHGPAWWRLCLVLSRRSLHCAPPASRCAWRPDSRQ